MRRGGASAAGCDAPEDLAPKSRAAHPDWDAALAVRYGAARYATSDSAASSAATCAAVSTRPESSGVMVMLSKRCAMYASSKCSA